jgi:TetR/AcrR family fatty acid metabolism transcriptional regulator
MATAKDKVHNAVNTRHAAKFQRILDAALEVFVRKGFFKSRISEVAHAAGLADGTIYLYFKNKEDLMASLLESKLEAASAFHTQQLHRPGNSRERLLRLIAGYVYLVRRESRLMLLLHGQLVSPPTPWQGLVRDRIDTFLQDWANVIADGQRSGAFTGTVDPILAAQLLHGALSYTCVRWARDSAPKPLGLQTIRKQVQRMALQMLSAEP